ncbi:MAG: hypothetical protein V3V31_06965 [Methylococcales bacterium]
MLIQRIYNSSGAKVASNIAVYTLFWLLAVASFYNFAEAVDFESANKPYRLGRGYTFNALNLTIGGYLSIDYELFENQTGRAKLDDLSLFLAWKPSRRLRFFSELELEDTFTLEGSSFHNHGSHFSVERLYADVLLNGQTTLRIGKFLTPVGRWNVIHASPLVWTTERPLVTSTVAFPAHASGLMLRGTVEVDEYDLDYEVYLDDTKDLDPKVDREATFQNAVGGHLNLNLSEQLQLGASYVNFRARDHLASERFNLVGVDFLWTKNRIELSGELIYRLGGKHDNDEKGLYAQAVIPVWKQIYSVTRYEYYDQGDAENELHLGIAGLAYRPSPPVVFKLEYRFGHHNQNLAPSGLLASFAVLF